MSIDSPRLLIIVAHPDDAEYHAGGLAAIYRRLERTVRIISVADGRAGHHTRTAQELVPLRRREAAAAGAVIGASYETWDYPDGELEPHLELRRRIVREIRLFAPDLVLTHRTCDYHPDHRAVGQAVQDASYIVTVPGYLPDVTALQRSPVIACMVDLFQKPCPMTPHVLLDVSDYVDTIVAMLACHRSQVFEWLPYEEGILDQVPQEESAKTVWLRGWYGNHAHPRAERFREQLIASFGQARGSAMQWIEAYEVSEYGGKMTPALWQALFPSC
jgi:LmbE family N-acetylglucosaminyl deacetylase